MAPPLLTPHKCRCRAYKCCKLPGGFNTVGRTTYYKHALADRLCGLHELKQEQDAPAQDIPAQLPDEPLPVQDLIPAIEEQMRLHDHYQAIDEEDVPQEEDPYGVHSLFHNWDQPLGVPSGTLLGELLLYYFEWMSSHIVTDRCAKAVHGLLCMLLPADHNFPNWNHLKKLLDKVYKNNVVSVELCPNDCIAFWDAKHTKYAGYRHAHRTKCPKCGALRHLTDITGKTVAAKTGYYFPMDDWMFSNLKDRDLDEHRDNDIGDFPAGHTRLSRGWHQKITSNPRMNSDPRHQALIGMADGIPIFKDKNTRGVCPIALRQGNQPDSLSKKFNNIHLSGLYPCDFWAIDDATGLLQRENHKPSNIGALLILLCDDLQFWYEGKWAVDYTMQEGDPQRTFLLRALLLFWCGDYPGLGEATNFVHKGYFSCHWCKNKGEWSTGLNRMVIGGYRRSKPPLLHEYMLFL
jgi:hypothetical protein